MPAPTGPPIDPIAAPVPIKPNVPLTGCPSSSSLAFEDDYE